MDTGKADTIVTSAVLGILIIELGNDYVVKDENPSFKFFIAVAVTAAVLAGIADVEPEIAAWIAVIIFIVVLMEDGAPLLKALQNPKSKAGEVQPVGSGMKVHDFPIIPVTKEKGKKRPKLFRPPPALLPLPVKVRKPSPVREPIKINLRRFPVPLFPAPVRVPGTNEGEVELPSGERIRVPWKDVAGATAAGISAAAAGKLILEGLAAYAEEQLNPIG